MPTHSRIGYVVNGIYKTAYCHKDGYPKYIGWVLFHCFTSLDKIKKLVSKGGFTAIDCYSETEAAPVGIYNGEDSLYYDSIEELLEEFDSSDEKYLYLFDKNRWIYYEHKQSEKNTPSDYKELSENQDVQKPYQYYFFKK